MEVVGDDHANELLVEGWKLLAEVPGGEPSAKVVVTFSTSSVNATVSLVIVVILVKVKSANSTLAKNHDDHPLSSAGRLRLALLQHFPGRDLQNFYY